jgi:hypothetical protein
MHPGLDAKYKELADHVAVMFQEAERQGMHIGLRRDPTKPNVNKAQEGPLVTKLRKLLKDLGHL